jgi:hypothetical protein
LCISLIFLCNKSLLKNHVSISVRYLFHDQNLAALPEIHWFKWTYFYDLCPYFRSAAVYVMTLLMRPAADTSVTPQLTGAILCRCWVEEDDSGNGSSERLCALVNSCAGY